MAYLCWKSMVTLLSLVDMMVPIAIQPFTNLLAPLASAAGQPSIKNWKLVELILLPFQCLIHFVYSNHVIKQNLCEKIALQICFPTYYYRTCVTQSWLQCITNLFIICKLMAILVVEFSSGGGTKLERCLHKNQHIQRKLLNFEFRINVSCQK